MLIFGGALFPYLLAAHSQSSAGYAPFVLGFSVSSLLGGVATYCACSSSAARIWAAIGGALIVGVSFVALFLFLTLNTLGS